VVLLELGLLGVGEHRVADLLGLHRRERGGLQRHQLAVDPQLGWAPGGDVEVGSVLLDHRLQQLVEVGHGVGSPS